MEPLVVTVTPILVGLFLRLVAAAELWVRLRWRERELREYLAHESELARLLPDGFSLDEVGADGSKRHLAAPSRGQVE